MNQAGHMGNAFLPALSGRGRGAVATSEEAGRDASVWSTRFRTHPKN